MNKKLFNAIFQELIDENPFAIRAVLKILEVQFTDTVATLAVTVENRPVLLVNLSFLTNHCRNEKNVKAVIIHEFLHVLLRHTEEKRHFTPARHLALDAVINAIIYRQYGPEYADMMSTYYRDVTDLKKLLRPMTKKERSWYYSNECRRNGFPQWARVWISLYAGKLIADDIESLADQFLHANPDIGSVSGPFEFGDFSVGDIGDLLGNHQEMDQLLPEELVQALDQSMKEMNGTGIWRNPKSRGIGANPYEALVNAKDEPIRRWQKKTLAILKQNLQPDRSSRISQETITDYQLPVLSPGDRRAFLRSLWAPFLPDATWQTMVRRRGGTAQVYLDVSGSMDAEMPLIISLLGSLSGYIRRPFWAFSDEVAPAVIKNGQLKTSTSGGTSMACVLEHIATTRPASAVVVTDGYIECVDPTLIARTKSTKIHAIVTRDGSPAALETVGIPYTQLDEVPA